LKLEGDGSPKSWKNTQIVLQGVLNHRTLNTSQENGQASWIPKPIRSALSRSIFMQILDVNEKSWREAEKRNDHVDLI